MLILGDIIPNFKADSTIGNIDFHDWIQDSWTIFFSHPNDFTPVCTTELARVAQLVPEFKKLGVKVIALSCNSVDSHKKWIQDIKSHGQITDDGFPYPIIADESRSIANKFGMLDPSEKDHAGVPLSARAVYIIDGQKRMRNLMLYSANTGRNFDEIIRVVKSLQLSDKHKIATPADWKNGDDVMVQPTVTDDEAYKLFPKMKTISMPSGKSYMRIAPQPSEM